jgi:SecD/SecF fusion protein
MTENLGRKITLTVVLVVLALAALLIPERPFRLGLDLQGGTRLRYSFDFNAALASGKISQRDYTDKATMLQEFCSIIRGRVDPRGVMELSVRPEGDDRVVIELPGAAELEGSKTFSKLKLPLAKDSTSITLDDSNPEIVKAFPLSGGLVKIVDEKIQYAVRDGVVLNGIERGKESTAVGNEYPAGAQIELLSNDDLQKRIENVGDMQFLIVANANDYARMGTDQTKETQKVQDWIKAHRGEPIDNFNRLAPDKGGPPAGLRWYPRVIEKGTLETPIEQRLLPLILPPPEWIFTGNDLEPPGISTDSNGYPAVQFEMASAKKTAFGDFTEKHIGDLMAIVLNGEVVTYPKINSKLPGGGIIEGGASGFTMNEVKDLVTVLKSGSLRIKPTLLDQARVGASLGDDYVRKSFISALVALALVVAFMVFFYHKLGVFSVIGLAVNVLLLMGSLAFLKATLTLPGVAGVILTLGMAVDSNILIYERLREEMKRGLKLIQAHKAAYERAAVTIIDSHVTQLIAGVILYYVGTGPIRGFATTLNIGILSTLFSVLIVTELMIVLSIKKGQTSFSLIKVLENPKLPFMSVAKWAMGLSLVIIVATNWLFIQLPDEKKLGIDFLGGFTMTVRTEQPQSIEAMRGLVAKVPGAIGQAEVKELSSSGSKATGYSAFNITYKLPPERNATAEAASGETGVNEIKDALAPVLQKEPVRLEFTPAEKGTSVAGELYFEAPHPAADISATLTQIGLTDVVVQPMPEHASNVHITATLPPDHSRSDLATSINVKFGGGTTKDSSGQAMNLLLPIPEREFVGAQVGGELRDKAILAVLLSLFGTILYLRVRFAEYGYGIAVVVSLLHDVLIALGALAVATKTGLIQAEVDLAMIAAFLTIIGYSQNDTIVIFDRVRENRPKSNKPLVDVLNDSINECLGRTILTTATVVLTLIVLFVFNFGTRNVLEGFSFAMLVGVISGAYSTVYVASPVLLWCEEAGHTWNQAADQGFFGRALRASTHATKKLLA